MKKIFVLIILTVLLVNTLYLLRGFLVYPYPSGDGLARWLYYGKIIHYGGFSALDDYPLLVPYLYSHFAGLNFPVSLLAFFIPYLILIFLIYYAAQKHRLSPPLTLFLALPLLTLPLLEQMSGRGMVGYADLFLSAFIAAALLFFDDQKYLPAILFALLAAHTKNEGQLFSFLVFIFYFRRTPLAWLLPLNLLLWRSYLLSQHLTWFYLALPSAPITLSLFLSRLPLLFSIDTSSLFNPTLFSLAGPVLILAFLSQSRPKRSQILILLLVLLYFLTIAFTPTSLDLRSHYLVCVDRLWLHLLVPFYLLTIPSFFKFLPLIYNGRHAKPPITCR